METSVVLALKSEAVLYRTGLQFLKTHARPGVSFAKLTAVGSGRTVRIPTKINADGKVVEKKKFRLHPHSHGLVETSDNEEHARKLAATPQDYYIGQIYGGSMCNGRTYESVVVKTNVCYTFMDYSQQPNWEQARDCVRLRCLIEGFFPLIIILPAAELSSITLIFILRPRIFSHN